MTEESKNCDNCNFFKKYYVKYKIYFKETSAGICVCPEACKTLGRKNFKKLNNCEFWAPYKPNKQDSIKIISDVLRDMENHFADIRDFLENEKE